MIIAGLTCLARCSSQYSESVADWCVKMVQVVKGNAV